MEFIYKNLSAQLERVTDTHAHLDACADPADVVVARARSARIDRIVAVGSGLDSCRETIAIAHLEQLSRPEADALVEDADAVRRAVGRTENFEDRERPAQQRLEAGFRLHHHELPGAGGAGHARCGQ